MMHSSLFGRTMSVGWGLGDGRRSNCCSRARARSVPREVSICAHPVSGIAFHDRC